MMSNELTPTDKPIEYTLETLPELLPQQQTMLDYILAGDNYTDAYRKAGYSSDKWASRSAFVLVSRNPLKAHLDYFMSVARKTVTPEWKVSKLAQIVNNSINKDEPQFYDTDAALKALAELNKMDGDYVTQPTMQINNLNGSIDDVRSAMKEYKKDC